jgi:excisionase family DNA binding protein
MPRKNLDVLESGRTDQPAIIELGHVLAAEPRLGSPGVFLRSGDQSVRLPESIIHGLRDMAQHLGRGAAIQVVPLDRELSLSEAAIILGVSREFLRKVVLSGDLQAERVGTHHRLTLGEVFAYRERRSQRRASILSELREQSAELGAYDERDDAR